MSKRQGKKSDPSMGAGLKRLRKVTDRKGPTVKCDNCGCMRYSACGCKRKG